MSYESRTGLGVASQYGPRETGVSIGVEKASGSEHRMSVEFTGAELASGFIPPLALPKYAVFTNAYLTVDEAFAGLTGVNLGEGNAEGTNGIALLLADLTALGQKDVASKLKGTWAVGVSQPKAVRVGLAVAGAVDKKVGRASLVLTYRYKRRKDNEFKVDPSTNPTGYRPQFKV